MAHRRGTRRLIVRVSIAFAAALATLTIVAFATGRVEYVVTHGVSMNPLYHQGDVVVVMPASHYEVGDIVAYRDQVNDLTVLHRIIGGDAAGWTVKGDNNQSVDAERPPSSAIVGRAVLHVPKIGAVIASPFGRVGVTAVVALVAFGIASISRRSTVDETESAPTSEDRRRRAHRTVGENSPRRRFRLRALRWPLVGVDVLLLIALVAAFVFSVQPGTPKPPLMLRGSLRYTADVEASDTYPTGHIGTGDPVFARLADTVAVTFDLDTDAAADHLTGSVQLDLVMANSAGWHSRVNLAASTPLVAGKATQTGSVDVVHLNEIVANVAEATGLNAGSVDLTIIATGSTSLAGGAPTDFSLSYQFSLNALALMYTGPAVADPAAGATAGTTQPALVATQPLTAPQPTSTGLVSTQTRMKILLALILCVAATFVLWPDSSDRDSSDEGAPDDVAEHSGHASCTCSSATTLWSAPRTSLVSTLPPFAATEPPRPRP